MNTEQIRNRRGSERTRAASGVALGLGLLTVGLGVWALVAPRSFFDAVALFPPYHEHFLHDVGAFQIGLGAGLLLALRWRDGLRVALGAYAIGGGLHTVAHIADRDLGGRATDVPILGALALLALVALLSRARELRAEPDAEVRRRS
jgi:hypothetical protein